MIPSGTQPLIDRFQGGPAHGDAPGFAALTHHKDLLGIAIDPSLCGRLPNWCATIKAHQLREPQTAGIHQLQHGPISGDKKGVPLELR